MAAQSRLNLDLGVGCGDEVEPARLGADASAGQDLHLVTVGQHLGDGYDLMIDLSPDTAVAQVGVHGVGEVQDTGLYR